MHEEDRALVSGRESINHATDLGALFQQQREKLVSVTRDIMAPSQEVQDAMRSVARAFGSVIAWQYQSVFDDVASSLRALISSLSLQRNDINWEELSAAVHQWGKYGWIPPDPMPISRIMEVPRSLKDADDAALKFMDTGAIEELETFLVQGARRRADTREAVELFRGKRYKPSAMLLCSLIEGRLLQLDRGNCGRRRSAKRVAKRAVCDIPESGAVVMSRPALQPAFEYYFKDANDFDRNNEGELNRNFLMHGMMYKPVRRKSCLKLMLLPREIILYSEE